MHKKSMFAHRSSKVKGADSIHRSHSFPHSHLHPAVCISQTERNETTDWNVKLKRVKVKWWVCRENKWTETAFSLAAIPYDELWYECHASQTALCDWCWRQSSANELINSAGWPRNAISQWEDEQLEECAPCRWTVTTSCAVTHLHSLLE